MTYPSPRKLQLRRGNTAQISSYTGPLGEVIINTDTWALYIQDGVTAGGHIVSGGGGGGSGTNYSNSNVKSYLTSFDGNIIPSANVTYSLGDMTHQWKSLYVSNNTIYINGVPLTIDNSGNLSINGAAISTVSYVNSQANVNLANYALNANVTAANVGLKGYVDSQSFYSNAKVNTYLSTFNGNIGNLWVDSTTYSPDLWLRTVNNNNFYVSPDDNNYLFIPPKTYGAPVQMGGYGGEGVALYSANAYVALDSHGNGAEGNIKFVTSLNNLNYSWNFDLYGNLHLPTGIDATNGVIQSANGIKLSATQLTVPSTVLSDGLLLNADLGEAYAFLSLPANRYANTTAARLGNDDGNVQISTVNQSLSQTHYWTFDTNGKITYPAGATFDGYDFIANTNSYIEFGSHNGNTWMGVDNHDGFIQVDWNGVPKQWTFASTGRLTLPNALGYSYIDSDAQIQINTSGYIWRFGTDATLDIPGAITTASGYRDIFVDPRNDRLAYIKVPTWDDGAERLVISNQLTGSAGIYFYTEGGYTFRFVGNQFLFPNGSSQTKAFTDNLDIAGGYINFTASPAIGTNGITFSDATFQNTAYSTSAIHSYLATHTDQTFGANVTIEGNLTVNGTAIYINTQSLVIDDNIVNYANANPGDSLDLGFVAHRTPAGQPLQHTGLVRDASDNNWKLFSNVTTNPGNTVDFTYAIYDDLVVGNITSPTITALNANATAQQTTLNTLLANAATQSDLLVQTNANITLANTTLKSYVDGQITAANTGSYSNAKVSTYLSVGNIANISVAGNVTATYFIGNGSQLTGLPSSYSNVNVQTYLPTYTGNIANIRLGVSGVLTFPDGTTMTTASVGGGSNYGNGNVASYLITNGYVNTNSAYANANVASYLPTYTGNIGAGNIVGTTPNVTITAGTYTTTFDTTGNVITPVGLFANGNVQSSGYFIGNGALLTGIVAGSSYSNVQVAAYLNTQGYNLYSNVNVAAYLTVNPISQLKNGANIVSLDSVGQLNLPVTTQGGIPAGWLVAAGNVGLNANGNLWRFGADGTMTSPYSVKITTTGVQFSDGTSQSTAYANIQTKAYVETIGLTNYSNVNAKAYTESMGFQNYGNVNVAAFTSGLTNYSNVNTAAYLATATITTTGNITAQNISGNISITGNVTGTSPNVTIQAGANLWIFDNQGNLTVPAGSDVIGSLAFTGNVTAPYFIGNGSQLTGLPSSYSNVQVAGYLGTGQIAVSNIKLSPSGNIVFADGTTQTTAAVNNNFGNVNVKAYTESMTLTNYANVNVASYLGTGQVTISNIKLAPSGNIVFADGTVMTTASVGGGSNYSNVNVIAYLNATGYNLYSNVNVAAYLATGQVTTSNIKLAPSGNIVFADGTVQTTAASGGSNYGNGNVASYLISSGYVNTNSAYGNGNVTSYLPTHSGNVGVSNLLGTTPNVTLIANSYSSTFDIYGNVAFGNALYPVQTYATGNVSTSGYFFGNGAFLTGIASSYSNVQVATYLASTQASISNIKLAPSGNIVFADGTTQITAAVNNNFGNVNVKAYTESMTLTNYSNVNVAAYLNATGYNLYSNVNVAAYLSSGLVTSANIVGTVGTGVYALDIGVPNTWLPNTVASFSSNVNNYTQLTLQNLNPGNDATAEIVITSDAGTDTTNFVDMGIINSGYDNTTPSNSLGNIVYNNDSYLYAQGNLATTTGGNLAIGTTTANKSIKFFAGGNTALSTVMTVANTGVSFNGQITTPSTNANLIINPYGAGNVYFTSVTPVVMANTLTVSGNVTAANFVGNIVQGSSANVQLVAGAYTSTFDNNGNLTLAGNITVPGSVTSNGGTNATAFAVVGNSAVSGVALGFYPTAGTAAEMAIRDYSTANSMMYFDTTVGSGNIGGGFRFRGTSSVTTYAQIDRFGVTQPTRPAFRVNGTGLTYQATSNVNLKGAAVTTIFNQGNYFDATTGKFTAPVAGLYQASLVARVGSNNGLNTAAVLKNGLSNAGNVVCWWETDTNAGTATHFGVSGTVILAVGDYLSANVLTGNITFDANDNWCVTYLG